ncbi:MAG: SRPBCC family protein [Xanthobacteraceae bacterium]
MTVLVIAVAVALIIVVAILAYAATRPDSFQVARSVTVNAPPERVFPLIDDLHAQMKWSPFDKDPNMKRTHSGAPRGKGAVYEWDGNRQVGAGRIAITDSTPTRITMALDMFRPLAAHNTVEFTLRPNGSATDVTWAMNGRQPFMVKLMSVFVNCDSMVGRQFEEGLGKLKALAEA